MLLKICFVLQQDGKLPFVPGDKEMVLGVSKYGVKVASLDQCVSRWSGYSSHPIWSVTQIWLIQSLNHSHVQDVLHRHPLYLIVRMLCYDDGLGAGKNLLALKTTDAKQEGCSIWVYQCSSSVSTKSPLFCLFKKVNITGRLYYLQEQAQSICKVLSASFDCALTSDKSWSQRTGEMKELQNQHKETNTAFTSSKVAIISPLLLFCFLLRG